MMLLYKDENLRKEMIQKGKQVIKEYNWDNTAALLWQCILKAHQLIWGCTSCRVLIFASS